MTSPETKGREFEIAQEVAELLDTLTPEQQRQVMAMLITRYRLRPAEPLTSSRSPYRPAPRTKPRSW
jgi:hypothetical protein